MKKIVNECLKRHGQKTALTYIAISRERVRKSVLSFDRHLSGIKSVFWEYSYVEECLEEFNKGKKFKYSLLLVVLP